MECKLAKSCKGARMFWQWLSCSLMVLHNWLMHTMFSTPGHAQAFLHMYIKLQVARQCALGKLQIPGSQEQHCGLHMQKQLFRGH